MVLMRGNKRVFETPSEETSSSGSVRTVSIYGVTSYNDLYNCIISIKSNAVGMTGTNTLNVNSLGVKNIMTYTNGSKSVLPDYWISAGQIYQVFYDGTDFVLLNSNSGSTSQQQSVVLFTIDMSSLVAGTYTQAQIEAILGQDFFIYLADAFGIIINDVTNGNKIYELLNTSSIYDSVADTNTFKFTLLDGFLLKEYQIVLDFNTTDYTVSISTIDLNLRNVNNTQY